MTRIPFPVLLKGVTFNVPLRKSENANFHNINQIKNENTNPYEKMVE